MECDCYKLLYAMQSLHCIINFIIATALVCLICNVEFWTGFGYTARLEIILYHVDPWYMLIASLAIETLRPREWSTVNHTLYRMVL